MPLNNAEKEFLAEWLEVADLDLAAAQRMLADSTVAYGYLIPFAFQQAVEKYCKGVLLANGMGFLRTHDLAELLATLPPAFVLTEAEQDDADRLAAYAVNTRYPPRSRANSDSFCTTSAPARTGRAYLKKTPRNSGSKSSLSSNRKEVA